MSSLPEELYHNILLRLPVKSLLICKCVCKSWFDMISDSDFVKTHLNATTNNPSLICITSCNKIYSVSYDSFLLSSQNEFIYNAVEFDYPANTFDIVQLLGSCNGLVLLWFRNICLWNPVTREYKQLPKSPNEYQIEFCALVYDYKISDYKVFKCVEGVYPLVSLVDVYTLESNSWKAIETFPYTFSYSDTIIGVLVNGSLHWLVEDSNILDTIISLDVSNDKFEEIELPKENTDVVENFGVFEGCLCVLTSSVYRNIDLQVWVMREYGVQESWSKHYVITHETIKNAYGWITRWSFNNGEILLQGYNGLILYDPRHSSGRVPKIGSLSVVNVENFVESLVSVNSSTSVERKENRRSDAHKQKKNNKRNKRWNTHTRLSIRRSNTHTKRPKKIRPKKIEQQKKRHSQE